MITGFIRTTITAIALLLFLSITINKKPIFNHVYGVISPLTTTLQNGTENMVSSSLNSLQDYAKKLFDNSRPKVRDQVGTKAAAPKRHVPGAPLEKITQEDKEALDSLIKNHR